MPSSVFPQTNFPRCVILDRQRRNARRRNDGHHHPADRGGDEGHSRRASPCARPPDAARLKSTSSSTGKCDMVQSELYVNSRIAQIRSTLPATATTTVWRLTFSAFPIIGVSLTSPTRDIIALWEMARYRRSSRASCASPAWRASIWSADARRNITSSSTRCACTAAQLSLAQVTDALIKTNLVAPAGMHEEDHTLYLTVVDGRVHDIDEIENVDGFDGEWTPGPREGFRARRARAGAGLQRGHRRRRQCRAAQRPQSARRQHARHRRRSRRPNWQALQANCRPT